LPAQPDLSRGASAARVRPVGVASAGVPMDGARHVRLLEDAWCCRLRPMPVEPACASRAPVQWECRHGPRRRAGHGPQGPRRSARGNGSGCRPRRAELRLRPCPRRSRFSANNPPSVNIPASTAALDFPHALHKAACP